MFDVILHIDKHLQQMISEYGLWIYLILFLIICAETGFVMTPFLPGDSLLFAAGAFTATGVLNHWLLILTFSLAAIIGDSLNFTIGKIFNRKASLGRSRLMQSKYYYHAQMFYQKYGGITIVLARFIPFIRTFAPIVAGTAKMNYSRFLLFSVIGGISWIVFFVQMGYFFGNLQIVKDNFSLTILAFIMISLIPPVLECFRKMYSKKQIHIGSGNL